MDLLKRHALPVAVGAALMLAFALGYWQRDIESQAMQIEYEQLLEQREADLQAQNELLKHEKIKCVSAQTRQMVYYASWFCNCDCRDPGSANFNNYSVFLK